MNSNRLYRGFIAVAAGLVLSLSGCGPGGELDLESLDAESTDLDSLDSESSAVTDLASGNGARGAVLDCHIRVPPSQPLDLAAAIIELEIDRVYKSARPGFVREWVPIGFDPDGYLFVDIVAQFNNASRAQQFSQWLEDGFVLGGVHFWDRPSMSLGYDCHVWEVLESNERPSDEAKQVMQRSERFTIKGADARQQLRGMWKELKREAKRRGHHSLSLLYSEQLEMATLMYHQDLPPAQRSLFSLVPIATQPTYMNHPPVVRSAWTGTLWFPFQRGDHGRPAHWPLPEIKPWNGDGVCSVSSGESCDGSVDCLSTCGNGRQNSGETWQNCPGDVDLFQ